MTPAPGILIFARMGSTRLPGKALRPLAGLPCLTLLLRRLAPSIRRGPLIVATSTQPEDDAIEKLARDESVEVFRGNLEDVLGRAVAAAKAFNLSQVVRVTGDCPLVGADSLDYFLDQVSHSPDAVYQTTKGHFPVGLDYEWCTTEALIQSHLDSTVTDNEREHMTLHIVNHPERFPTVTVSPPNDWPTTLETHFTLDTADDLKKINRWLDRGGDPLISTLDLLKISGSQ